MRFRAGPILIDCVIAAAGGSTRMGRPKQLLPFGPEGSGLTMLGSVVAAALEAGCRALVVLGCRAAEVEASLRGGPLGPALASGLVAAVPNPRWEEGMLGSIQAALGQVRGEAFFEMHADMPLVPASAYGLLAAARDARRRAGLPEAALFASFRGEPGHPVLIPSAWIPEILGLEPGSRLKPFLAARGMELVEAGDPAVLADLDTPEEYRRARGS